MNKNNKKLLSLILIILVILVAIAIILSNKLKSQITEISTNSTASGSELIDNGVNNESENPIASSTNTLVVINTTAEEELIGENPDSPFKPTNADEYNVATTSTLPFTYFSVKTAISNFNDYQSKAYYKKQDKIFYNTDIDYYQRFYNLLDKKYTSENSITKDNVKDVATGTYNFVITGICEALENDTTSDYNTFTLYFVDGYRINNETEQAEDYGYILRVDVERSAYSVFPYDYIVKHGYKNVKEGTKVSISNERIEKYDENFYRMPAHRSFDLANECLALFKQNALYKPELAFAELDSEYAKKFGSAEGLKVYVANNKSNLNKIFLKSLDKDTKDNINTYTCFDSNNNQFIIKQDINNIFAFKISFSNIIF